MVASATEAVWPGQVAVRPMSAVGPSAMRMGVGTTTRRSSYSTMPSAWPTPVNEAAANIIDQTEVDVPTVVGAVEALHRIDRRARRIIGTIEADGLALRWHIEPLRSAVFAVHADQIPQAPCDRGERRRIRRRRAQIGIPPTTGPTTNRPAPLGRLPEVLIVGAPSRRARVRCHTSLERSTSSKCTFPIATPGATRRKWWDGAEGRSATVAE